MRERRYATWSLIAAGISWGAALLYAEHWSDRLYALTLCFAGCTTACGLMLWVVPPVLKAWTYGYRAAMEDSRSRYPDLT